MTTLKRALTPFSCLVMVLLVACSLVLEQTRVGHWLEMRAYELLSPTQAPLTTPSPIVIVDISRIPADPDHPTSRPMLTSVIRQVAASEPAAIGVDIDFSPFPGRPPSQEENDFFQYCEELSTRKANSVPVFLGVGRTAYQKPDDWFSYLNNPFANRAAAITVAPHDTRRMVRWIVDTNGETYGKRRALPSLAQAVATAYLERHNLMAPGPGLRSLFVDKVADPFNKPGEVLGGESERFERNEDLEERASLVNYSKLDSLVSTPSEVVLEKGQPKVKGHFQDKVVLLGDASLSDVFTIPGGVRPIRGLYLNASAAYTFIYEPLYSFSIGWRVFFDLLLGVVLLTIFTRLEDLGVKWAPWWRILVEVVAIIIVALLAFSAIFWLNILWTSSIILAAGACAHVVIHDVYHDLRSSRKKGGHSGGAPASATQAAVAALQAPSASGGNP